MEKIYVLLGLILIVNSAYPSDFKGVRPHASRADYSVTCFTEDIGVGATLLHTSQVRRLFGPEIEQNYIVVEVGFYSKNRLVFEVRHSDFKLRNRPSRTLVHPADPRVILSTLSKPVQSLVEMTLPEAPTSQALAGYLFFPNTDFSASFYELDYTGYGAWLTLPLKP
jgi:hypothetical protein